MNDNTASTRPQVNINRTCFVCSTTLVDDAIYCHRCGTKQPPPTLVLRSDERTYTLNDISKVWVVGRTIEPAGNYVDVDLGETGGKQGVSRRHAELTFDEHNYFWSLRDASSQYGTFVDEVQLQPEIFTPIRHGQTLRFGGIALSVEFQY